MPHTAPGPRRLRAAPPGLRGRGATLASPPRGARRGQAAATLRAAAATGPGRPVGAARTPGGASASPAPSLPPPGRHRRLHRLLLPLVPPPDLVSGAGARCWAGTGGGVGGRTLRGSPAAPPRRDGPHRSPPAPRPRRGRAAAAASQVKSRSQT